MTCSHPEAARQPGSALGPRPAGLAGASAAWGTRTAAVGVCAAALGALGALSGAPALAQPVAAVPAATVRCASPNYQYEFCPVPTGNRVMLQRQRSRSACRPGETWGFNPHGVWVTQGCAADFLVGGTPAAPGPGTQPAPVPERGITPVRPVITPGVGPWPPGQARPLPPVGPLPGGPPTRWSSNTYIAVEPGEPGQMRLVVAEDGTVQGKVGERSFTGRITDTWLQTDRGLYRLQPSGTGFLATDERDPQRRIQFDMDVQRN